MRSTHTVRYVSPLFCCLIIFVAVTNQASGQLTEPDIQPVYGATIRTIDTIYEPGGTANVTRIFVATESPNSVFYADVDHNKTGVTNLFGAFSPIPDLDGNGNHGIPSFIATHQASERLFVADDDEGLLSCTTASGSLTTDIVAEVTSVLIPNSTNLFALGSTNGTDQLLFFGSLDGTGAFTPHVDSPIPVSLAGYAVMAIHPTNNALYLFDTTDPTNLLKSSDPYTAISGSTLFSSVPVDNTILSWDGEKRFGIGPDGRFFINGATSLIVQIMYSDDDGSTWILEDTQGTLAGTSEGMNVLTVGSAGGYEVFIGTVMSTNKGTTNTWVNLPRVSAETHVNMGCTVVDPVDSNVFYVSTDQGIGSTTNRIVNVFEINDGLAALQIYDIDVSTNKDLAWLGSKSGAWRATGFATGPTWVNTRFPDGMAISAAMDPSDTNGTTAYVGSRRVWKTTTGGGTNASDWTQVLTALTEDGVSGGIPDGSIKAIEVNSNITFAGYHGDCNTNAYGRLYSSTNEGSAWTLIETNIDIKDLLLLTESGTSVLYVATAIDPAGTSHGIYRYTESGGLLQSFTNRIDVTDLAADSTGGIYAATIATQGAVKVYFKARGSSTWDVLTTNGLPNFPPFDTYSSFGPALTVGTDLMSNTIPYLAMLNTIFYLPQPGTNWVTSPALTYPSGSQIYALIWDDLLAGTDIGLYAQDADYDEDGLSDTDETGVYFTDPVESDTDGDWLLDGEEVVDYGTSPTNTDTDADGMRDGAEIVAGTEPTNATSYLHMIVPDADAYSGTGYVVHWSSVSGKSYDLERSTNLLIGFGSLTTNITATDPVNTYTDTTALGESPYYYRIGVGK